MIILVLGESINYYISVWTVDECLYHSHFLKEDLPRIRYANPKIDIQVNKLVKMKEDAWQPELVLDFGSFPFTVNHKLNLLSN
jgi:hypothetical protein